MKLLSLSGAIPAKDQIILTKKFNIMSYLILTKRVFNSPLIEFCNFQDSSNINLIRLNKPYKNGVSFAVYETTKNPFLSNGLFKTYEEAKQKFDSMVKKQSYYSKILNSGVTNN